MTLAASIALVFAGLFDGFGLPKWLGGRWVGDRLAALCVLFAAGYFLLGSWLTGQTQSLGKQFTAWLARTLAPFLGPKVADAIGLYALGLVIFVLFVIWLGMLWPHGKPGGGSKGKALAVPGKDGGASKVITYGGKGGGGGGYALTSLELNSLFIWVPPIVFALGAGFVPGGLGTFVRATIGLLASVGQAIGSGLA